MTRARRGPWRAAASGLLLSGGRCRRGASVGARWRAAAVGLLLSGGALAAEPVHTLDLRALYGAAPASLAERRQVHDALVVASCVQGLANRAGPNLYTFYTLSAVQAGLDTDQLWWDRLADPAVGAGILAGRPVIALPDLDAAVDAYAGLIQGLAVWDEAVPATLNAAYAAAAASDLLVVRHDPAPDSLFTRLSAKFPAVVSLVNPDGSSRFLDKQGAALVPDTTRQTSQSAKADAYAWVIEKYLKPGKLNPTEFGYMLDGFWLQKPTDYAGNLNATHQLQIANRDWLIARRGMPFDLSPWQDVTPTDDPGQPLGTDPAILTELMATARAQTSDVLTIRGFFGWQFKYTTLQGLPPGHEPVLGEWTSVKHVSPFAAGLDADAPGLATLANASFFAHVPLDEVPEPQRRPTAEDLIGNGFLRGLASNGGFEDGEEGWTVQLTNHVVYSDTLQGPPAARSGLRYLQCNTADVGDNGQNQLFRDGPPVAPGTRVTLRGFVRSKGAPVTGLFMIDALGGGGEFFEIPFVAGPTWSEVRLDLDVVQGGNTGVRGTILLATPGANLDLDDVAFYAGDPAQAPVEPANYVLWFAGDWDAASWMYGFSPVIWDAPGRGLVPLAWDFSGHVLPRIPPFARHVLATRTERDFFFGADSGPGYGNPSQMGPEARAIWRKAGAQAARRLDQSALWVLDPLAPLDAEHLDAVAPFAGDGVVLTSSGIPTPSLVGTMPVDALIGLDGATPDAAASWVLQQTPPLAAQPQFRSYRAVLWKPLDLAALTHKLALDEPSRRFRIVDPFSYFYLLRRHLGAPTTHRASFRLDPVPGQAGAPTSLSFKIRNDGWDTWRAAGPNPYRVGFHLAPTSPAPGALPVDPAAYPVRLTLPYDLAPGKELSLTAQLPAVPAGSYSVQADVVEEGVSWFETRGDLPIQFTLAVQDAVAGAGGAAGSSGGAGGVGGAAGGSGGVGGSGAAGGGAAGGGGSGASGSGGAASGGGGAGGVGGGAGGMENGGADPGGNGGAGGLPGGGAGGMAGGSVGGKGGAGGQLSGSAGAAEEDGGCGCRVATGSGAGGPWGLLGALLGVLLGLRRRRRLPGGELLRGKEGLARGGADLPVEIVRVPPLLGLPGRVELLGALVARFAEGDPVLDHVAAGGHPGAIGDVVRVQLDAGLLRRGPEAAPLAAVASPTKHLLPESFPHQLLGLHRGQGRPLPGAPDRSR